MAALRSEPKRGAKECIAWPWPYLIVEHFLTRASLAKSVSEIKADTYAYDIEQRGTGRIEFSLLKSKTRWTAIYSNATVSLLSSAFGVDVGLNKQTCCNFAG